MTAPDLTEQELAELDAKAEAATPKKPWGARSYWSREGVAFVEAASPGVVRRLVAEVRRGRAFAQEASDYAAHPEHHDARCAFRETEAGAECDCCLGDILATVPR